MKIDVVKTDVVKTDVVKEDLHVDAEAEINFQVYAQIQFVR